MAPTSISFSGSSNPLTCLHLQRGETQQVHLPIFRVYIIQETSVMKKKNEIKIPNTNLGVKPSTDTSPFFLFIIYFWDRHVFFFLNLHVSNHQTFHFHSDIIEEFLTPRSFCQTYFSFYFHNIFPFYVNFNQINNSRKSSKSNQNSDLHKSNSN